MRVRLADLRANPMRDFAVDPLDPEIISRLRASISEHGFWGGVVCRAVNGHYEIAAGQHRVESALQEGVDQADVHVAELDDLQMLRLYAQENATQRGSAHSTARVGSVAGALRIAAKEIMRGDVSLFSETSPKAMETLQGQAKSDKGIGAPHVHRYLAGTSGVTDRTVRDDMAALKNSGEYARILAEVRDELIQAQEEAEREAERLRRAAEEEAEDQQEALIDEEARVAESRAAAARVAAGRAGTAADKAAETAVTFDYRGVAPILSTAHHLAAFRDLVTSEVVQSYLPVSEQAVLAQRLVQLAQDMGGPHELTGLFIRTNTLELIGQMRESERAMSDREKARLLAADWREKFLALQEHYLNGLCSVIRYGQQLEAHLKEVPEGETLPIRSQYYSHRKAAEETIQKIEEKLG